MHMSQNYRIVYILLSLNFIENLKIILFFITQLQNPSFFATYNFTNYNSTSEF